MKPILEWARHRFAVAAAEVDHQDQWQRSRLGVAAVSSTASHLEDILDEVERWVWSFPEVEVVAVERTWLETAS